MGANWLDRRISAPGPYLTLCLSEAEYLAAASEVKMPANVPWIRSTHSHATAHYFEAEAGLTCIVCLSGWEGRDSVEVAGLLVHEAVHAWQAYARSIGEDSPGDEQEAYAVQSIAQELMAEFARRVAGQEVVERPPIEFVDDEQGRRDAMFLAPLA